MPACTTRCALRHLLRHAGRAGKLLRGFSSADEKCVCVCAAATPSLLRVLRRLHRHFCKLVAMLATHVHHLAWERVVLASQSPRRAQLLREQLLLSPEIVPSNVSEELEKSEQQSCQSYAKATAQLKALDVASKEPSANLVIGGDTIVHDSSTASILEKPSNREHAINMLLSLSNRSHCVTTGVCLVLPSSNQRSKQIVRTFSITTIVHFDDIPRDAVEAYVDSGRAFGKAGAYGIQDDAGSFTLGIDGCFFNVMGLPVNQLASNIRRLIEEGSL